jgi:hypothetical protein
MVLEPYINVARGQLPLPGLQAVLQRAVALVGDPRQDGEDGPDVDVGADVRGAVERVEVDHVLARPLPLQHGHDPLILLGREHGELPGRSQQAVQGFVGVAVEALHPLAVHVLLAGLPEDVHEPRPDHQPVDHLRGQGDLHQEVGELARDLRMPILLLEDELRQGQRGLQHLCF